MALCCAPVLTYPKVRSAPVLANHHFRLGLIRFPVEPYDLLSDRVNAP